MLVIHMGLPKAGSATMQTFFTMNEDALRAISIDYVKLGRFIGREALEKSISAHHNFANELKDRSNLYRPGVGSIRDLSEYARNAPYSTMVISSEMFENCTSDRIREFKNVLSSSGQSVLVIMIMRDFINLVPSSYAQKIKRGFNIYDFDTFFEQRIAEERASYFSTADNWARNFGWENMRVRLLDNNHLLNGDLIDDFLNSIGIDADDPRIRSLPRRERVNESSGWKTLEATRALFSGRHGLEDHHPLAIFAAGGSRGLEERSLRRADGKRFEKVAVELADRWGWKEKGRYLTRSQAQRCLDIYEDSVRKLNEALPDTLPPALGLEERGFVERSFLPDATHIAPDELRAFYDEVWSKMARQHKSVVADKQKTVSPPRRPRPDPNGPEGLEKKTADVEVRSTFVGRARGASSEDRAARKAARAARKAIRAAKRSAEAGVSEHSDT